MEKDKTGQIIQLDWHHKDGVWLSPAEAAPYFRNGKGLDLEYLMKKLRSGKLNDVAMEDAFGWWIFIPDYLLEKYNPFKAA